MSVMPLDTKGKRPTFFNDKAVDALMTIVLEIMAENWTLKERLFALEKTLVDKGVLEVDSVEKVTWSDSEKMAHETERQRILTDAFRALNSEFVGRAARQKDIDS